jgi:hypothetical protein
MTETSLAYDEDGVHDPFLVALQKTLRPELLDDAGEKLAELIEAVNAHGKKGSLTLQITLDPHERVLRAVEVTAVVKAKPPEPKPVARIAYAHRGRLHRNDPLQDELPGMRAVPAHDRRDEETA